jgi:hypothetical protein
MSSTEKPFESFDAAAIIGVLNRHGVRYVVIGAFAAQLHGAPIPRTRDIGVTPASDRENLARLSAALHELRAQIRTPDVLEGLPFDHDGPFLGRARVWNLTTPHGEFDVSFVPSGTDGYADLARNAHIIDVFHQRVPTADLDDVIRSKEAGGRPNDLLHLPILLQTSARLHERRKAVDRSRAEPERAHDTGPEIGH